MPKQETFLAETVGNKRVEVLKTYDRKFAREAFEAMDDSAQNFLWKSLNIEDKYDDAEIPNSQDPESSDFLWEELLDESREDGHLLSFFVVNETDGTGSELKYVAPDWPSAERFAKERLALSA